VSSYRGTSERARQKCERKLISKTERMWEVGRVLVSSLVVVSTIIVDNSVQHIPRITKLN
jgi:hypothetical protein